MRDEKPRLPRLLIVGGGPIGLELAVAAVHSQRWHVTIAERGISLCANVVAWEHVRLFSAWKLNTTAAGTAALASFGYAVPGEGDWSHDGYPTGTEFLARYLRPLGDCLARSGRCDVLLDTEVVTIGKNATLLKGDMGAGRRKAASFRTLVVKGGTEERLLESDAVVDASGTYGRGNWLGAGGVPALGERACPHVVRTIPHAAADAARYLDRTTAVVGSAYSAITTVSQLRDLAAAHPAAAVTVHWCTRRGHDATAGRPLYEKIDDDPLPQRDTLARLANALATGGSDGADRAGAEGERPAHNFRLVYHPHVQLEAISSNGPGSDDTVNLLLRDVDGAGEAHAIEHVSTVIANVGFRPDLSLFRELHVHQCYASEGPMKLAAALMASSGAGSADCLAQVAPGKETLVNPEPAFYVVGMKSYGRSSKFLLAIGHEQVRHVLELLNAGL